MKRKTAFLLVIVAIAVIVMAHSAGISGETGSPGESTCAQSGCHSSFTLNSGPGSIVITDNVPVAGYTAGQVYTINVIVSQTGFPLFGFDFEALNSSNKTAGSITVTSATTTQLMTSGGRQNITHKTNGGLTSNTHTFSFSWTAPATGTGTVSFYTAGIAANDNGNSSGDYVYSKSITVPELIVPTIVTGSISGSPFCAGQTGISIPYTVTGTYTAGNVFTAQLSDAAGSFASPTTLGTLSSTASGTITSTVALPSVAGTLYRIRVVANNPVTTGTDNGANLTINLPATTANAGTDQTVCGAAATLAGNTATVGTGTWTLVSGAGIITTPSSPTSAVTALGEGANTFTWTITNTCGTSSGSIVITSVTPPTTANAGTDQTACTTSATLAGNTPTSGTGLWTLVSGTGIITAPSSATSTVTEFASGANTFGWTISNPPCTPSTDDVVITQSGTITVADAGPDQTICSSTSSITLAADTAVVGTGTWSVISGSGIITTPSSPTSTVTGLTAGTSILRWTIANGVCTSSTDDVSVFVNPEPTIANAGVDQTVCTTFATFAGNTPAVGTGTWSLLSGAGTITKPSSPTSIVTGLGVGANTFRWTISNLPCIPSTDDVVITQSGTITVADAGTNQTVCGTTTTLEGDTAVVGTGVWSLISGAGTLANPSSPISTVTGLAKGVNQFCWTISFGTCPSTKDTVTITSSNIPTEANAGPAQNICGTSATMAANTPLIGTGSWTVVSGSGLISAPASPLSTITGLGEGINKFAWTISNPPCPSSADTVAITAYTNPSVSNAGANQTICDTTANMTANTPSAGTGEWSLISGSGVFTNAANPATTITGLANGVNVFKWTISNGTCPPSASAVTVANCESITTGTIIGSPFCSTTSYSVIVPFTTMGTFTGFYSAELSDSGGSFATPVTIGSSSSSPIYANIPSSAVTGTKYRIRVVNSNPAFAGSDNGFNLQINTCSPIVTGTITGSPFCASTTYNVSVPFTFTGGLTGPFVAELSDASGSFAAPLTIGYAYSSPIAATIPSGTPSGVNYRIRVSDATAVVDGEVNENDISINTCADGIYTVTDNDLIKIYPNPVNDELIVEGLNNADAVKIFSIIGNQMVFTDKKIISGRLSIEVSLLSEGVYWITIERNGMPVTRKFMKL